MCPVIRLLSVYTNTENLFSVGAIKDLPYSFSLLLQKPSHPHYNTYKISLLCRSVNRALFALWLTFSAIVISLFIKINNNFTVITLCHPLKKRNGIVKVSNKSNESKCQSLRQRTEPPSARS